jgi:hypothetical protein
MYSATLALTNDPAKGDRPKNWVLTSFGPEDKKKGSWLMNATQTFLNDAPTASGLLEMRHRGVSKAPNAANYTTRLF